MNILVAQSGGPTAAINASLLGVYRQARTYGEIGTVYGALNGIEGLLQGRLVSLNEYLPTEREETLLRQTPAAFLGSCRHRLRDGITDFSEYRQIQKVLEEHDIGAMFYIGGNDSMDTVHKLSRYFERVKSPVRVMGVPKTIDNDLLYTDHTPGYGSAAKYVATATSEIIRDCAVYEVDAVTIIEIMGRDTGWLTAAAALPRLGGEIAPHLIYLPETSFTTAQFLDDVRRVHAEHRAAVIAVSEGVLLNRADEFQSGAVDNFGHKYLAGIGKCLEHTVRTALGCKVRSVELNTPQRCAAHWASQTDLNEAEKVAAAAVQAAMEGHTGEVSVIRRVSDAPYTVEYDSVPVEEVANRVKYVPRDWINDAGNDVTEKVIRYILPLIQGETLPLTDNGIPLHLHLKETHYGGDHHGADQKTEGA